MKKAEIHVTLADAVELLRNAQAGMGTSEQRTASREKAGELLASLPENWWRRLGEDADPLIAALGVLA